MAERYEPDARDAEAAEYLPLARAAALAHGKLFAPDAHKDAKTLDLLGLALSAVTPLYTRDAKSGALRPVTAAELAQGRFARGAARLEFASRDPLRFLLVSRREVYRAIEAIAKDPASPILRMCRLPQPAAYSSTRGA